MLGIVCGLESEAVLARRIPNSTVVCAAAQPAKARRYVQELVDKGATRLMSFGIAGALEPGLPIGSMIIGTYVQSVAGKWMCDSNWINDLIRKLPRAHSGGVWGSEFLVPTAKDKRALYEKSRCLIVDMESQCMAEIAATFKLPIAVIRTVCDSSSMDVPPLVMDAIADDGSINIAKALGSIIRNPTQIPALVHVSKGTGEALKVLGLNLKELS